MKKMTTTLTLAAAVSLAMATLGAPLAYAQAAPEATPDHAVSFNAAVTSDYRYRGISQTRLEPALQGGVDYTHNPSGFYAGAWASTIKWVKDAGGDSDVELDFYAGKRGKFGSDLSYDVGVLSYVYPNNEFATSANTVELYGQLGFGPAYVKYSHSTTDLFGTADSKNSGYLDVGANFDVAKGLVLNLHIGRQKVRNNSAFSYTDYKIGLTKDLGWGSLALAVVDTNTDVYISPVNGKDLGKTGAVLTLSKTF
jgi:uncharacterized protein (TIGR02001 family)